jgi:hypothetical protein
MYGNIVSLVLEKGYLGNDAANKIETLHEKLSISGITEGFPLSRIFSSMIYLSN